MSCVPFVIEHPILLCIRPLKPYTAGTCAVRCAKKIVAPVPCGGQEAAAGAAGVAGVAGVMWARYQCWTSQCALEHAGSGASGGCQCGRGGGRASLASADACRCGRHHRPQHHARVQPSSLGGATTCIVCFARPKTHLAAPCGHQSVCSTCGERMQLLSSCAPIAACQCSCGCSTVSSYN